MNWGAHLFLSEPCVHHQVGNVIADYVRGRAWPKIHPSTNLGLKVHRKIDAFTDSHEAFRRSQQRLRSKGFLRAVAIDLSYDHMLIKNWARYNDTCTAREFIDGFYQRVEQVLDQYPVEVSHFLRNLIAADTLGRYAQVKGIKRGMHKVDQRLSERVLRKERASDYFDDVTREYDNIEADFLEFFPALQQHIAQHK
jgi:acyl carrier protein phosphodiesterase